jgi:serine/threonine protein kinase
MTAVPEKCSKCYLPKNPQGSGSLTQWITCCRCDAAPPIIEEKAEDVNLCSNCGKRLSQGRVGSFTQFIFRFDICSCEKPTWAPDTVPYNEPAFETNSDSLENFESESDLEFDPSSIPTERYKPLQMIGAGSGGKVYLCHDLLLNKLVALKTLNTLVGEQLVAFQNEAKLLSKLDHPNIIKILDFGATISGAPYMVLEHSPGSNLMDALETNGPLTPGFARQVFTDLCHALSYCHERGVFHRDLKPANILFTKMPGQQTAIKLIDFGIATAGNHEKTRYDGRDLIGTPTYMPPDQMLGLIYDARSEIYSLGCVLFESLTGHQVFEGETALEILTKHATEAPPLMEDVTDAEIPESMQNIVSICLSKDPDDRYQTTQALVQALSSSSNTAENKPNSKLIQSLEVPHSEQAQINNKFAKKSNAQLTKLAALPIAIGSIISLAYVLSIPKTEEIKPPLSAVTSHRKIDAKKTYQIFCNGSSVEISGDDITLEAFKELARKRETLRTSLLFGNEPKKVDWSGLRLLKDVPIHSLMVERTNFGDNECEIVASFPKLLKLDARFTHVTDIGVKSLSQSKTLVQVQLSSTKATTDCLKYLKRKPGFTILKINSLPLKQFSDLQNLKDQPFLTRLDIGNVKIGNEGLKLLCQLRPLYYLDVSNCGITDSGAPALAKSQVQVLALSDAGITDKIIPHLSKMPNLTKLLIGPQAKITQEGEKRLQSAKPTLKISHGQIVSSKIEDALNGGIQDFKELDPNFFSSAAEQIANPNSEK